MRGLAVLVEMAQHLAVPAGVAVAMARWASGLRGCGGWRTSFETERTHLFQLMLMLAELWILPYKGLEAAMSICLDQVCPYLFLALRVFPSLVLVVEPLLPGEDFQCFNVTALLLQFTCLLPTVPQLDYICVHAVIS
jgi:hypothetical protein